MTFGCELALAAILLGPAQQPARPGATTTDFAVRPANVAVYEDIEVMRQLLARKLGSRSAYGGLWGVGDVYDMPSGQNAYGSNTLWQSVASADGQTTYSPRAVAAQGGDPNQAWNYFVGSGTASAASVEGAHVDGHGVVFTVTLPAAAGDPRPSTSQTTPAAVSDWDRIRRELKGEKTEAGPTTRATPQSAGDIILHALAENGHNFKSLAGSERLTVVVTFRGPQRVTGRSQSPFRPALSEPVRTPPAQGAAGEPALGATGQPRSARDYELLADLHLKQQQYQQSLEAIRRGLNAAETAVKEGPADADKDARKLLTDLYSKQAQALLALGRFDEARATLDRAKKMTEDATAAAAAPPKPSQPQASRLPAKLIISARKELLDAVGSGKVDFETFRKQASVEYVAFGDEKAKP